MSSTVKRGNGTVAASLLLLVLLVVALLLVGNNFRWPLWQAIALAVAVGAIAGGANYFFAQSRKRDE